MGERGIDGMNQRAVRQRIGLLMEKVKKSNREDKRASGIGTEKELIFHKAIEDLIVQKEEMEAAAAVTNEQVEEENVKREGAEIRKRAMETHGETR